MGRKPLWAYDVEDKLNRMGIDKKKLAEMLGVVTGKLKSPPFGKQNSLLS